jgi:long-chain acyl-CoA synthetase
MQLKSIIANGNQKMIKSPLFHQATEQNGISWILVFTNGAQNVPIYPTITEDDYEYILNQGAIYCFVSDAEILQVNLIKDKVPKEVFSLIPLKVVKLEGITSLGKDHSNQTDVETSKSLVKPKRFSTIIYTSGTTGRPKGVMLS